MDITFKNKNFIKLYKDSIGFCYVRWLEQLSVYNSKVELDFSSLSFLVNKFGKFPKIKDVICFMYKYVDNFNYTFYLPDLVNVNQYHIHDGCDMVSFSYLMHFFIDTDARVGGDNYTESRKLGDILDGIGFDAQAAVADVIKKKLIAGDTEVTQGIETACMNRINDIYVARLSKERLALPMKLTQQEEINLQHNFPELNLVYTNKTIDSHGYAHASRLCEVQVLFKKLGVDFLNVQLEEKYRNLVTDIGGKLMMHLKRGRGNVHCCSPLLSSYDSLRLSKSTMELSKFVPRTRNQAAILNEMRHDPEKFQCHRRAQHCDIRTPYGIMLHSVYDMSVLDIADMFERKDMMECVGSFIFSSIIISDDEGILEDLRVHFKKYYCKNEKKKKISFSFINDPSLNYVHDYDAYISLLTSTLVISTSGRVQIFIELQENRSGIQFFHVTRNLHGLPTHVSEFKHKIFFEKTEDYVFVSMWLWDSLKSKNLAWFKGENMSMSRVSFRAPRFLVDKLLAYANGITEGKFQLAEVYTMARSLNSRVIVGGKDVVSPISVPAERLYYIALAVYIKSYCMRYDVGMSLQMNLRDVHKQRADTREPLAWKAVKKLFNFWNLHRKDLGDNEVNTERGNSVEDIEADLDSFLPFNGFFSDTTKWMAAWVSASTFLPLQISDCVKFLEVDELIRVDMNYKEMENLLPGVSVGSFKVDQQFIEKLVDDVDVLQALQQGFATTDPKPASPQFKKSSTVPFSIAKNGTSIPSTIQVESTKTSTHITENITQSAGTPVGISVRMGRKTSYPQTVTESTIPRKKEKKTISLSDHVGLIVRATTFESKNIKKILGDGQCFYSALDYVLGTNMSPREMRAFLYNSKFMQENDFDLKEQILKELADINVWGNLDIAIVAAVVFQVQICIHIVVDGISSNQSVIITPAGKYFRKVCIIHNNVHFDALKLPCVCVAGGLDELEPLSLSAEDLSVINCSHKVQSDPYAQELQRGLNDLMLSTNKYLDNIVESGRQISPEFRVFLDNIGLGEDQALSYQLNSQRFLQGSQVYQSVVEEVGGSVVSESECSSRISNYSDYRDAWERYATSLKQLRYYLYINYKKKNYRDLFKKIDIELNAIEHDSTSKDLYNRFLLDKYIAGLTNKEHEEIATPETSTPSLPGDVLQPSNSIDNTMAKSEDLLDEDAPIEQGVRAITEQEESFSSEVSSDIHECCVFSLEPVNVPVVERKPVVTINHELRITNSSNKVLLKENKVRIVETLEHIGYKKKKKIRFNLFGKREKEEKKKKKNHPISPVCGNSILTPIHVPVVAPAQTVITETTNTPEQSPIYGEVETVSTRSSDDDSGCCSVVTDDITPEDSVSQCGMTSNKVLSRPALIAGLDRLLEGVTADDRAVIKNFGTNIKRGATGGIVVVASELKNSPLVMHFVHDNVGKGYAGFAGDVMRDCIGNFVEISDKKKKNKNLSYNMFYVTQGKNFKNVINVVSNKFKFKFHLMQLIRIFNKEFTGCEIHTVPIGTGLWGHSIEDVMEILQTEPLTFSLVIHCLDKSIYEKILKSMGFTPPLARPGVQSEVLNSEHYNFRPGYIDEQCRDDMYINMMLEQRELWRYAEYAYLQEHRKIFKKININNRAFRLEIVNSSENYGVIDGRTGHWCVKPKQTKTNYMCGFIGSSFEKLKYDQDLITVDGYTGYILVSDYTHLMLDTQLYERVKNLELKHFEPPIVTITQGVPGCGKTTEIIKSHKALDLDRYDTNTHKLTLDYDDLGRIISNDLVLTSTREGAEDLRLRIEKQGKFYAGKRFYRTTHSYILNSTDTFETVYVDEALMRHPGEILLIALLSQCSRMVLLGDVQQIPYVNRMQHIKLRYDNYQHFKVGKVLNVSYRCPVDVAAVLSSKYPDQMYSTSNIRNSISMKKINSLSDVPKVEGVKYLVFKQSEKEELISKGYNVSTVHEFQGKQNPDIYVVRLSSKVEEELYKRYAYALVAISRHTRLFIYYTMVTSDALGRMASRIITDAELRQHVKILPAGYEVGVEMVNRGTVCVEHERFVNVNLSNDIKPMIIRDDIVRDIFVEPIVESAMDGESGININRLQFYYDEIFPGNSTAYMENDSYIVAHSDLEVNVEHIILDISKPRYIEKKYDHKKPVLRTAMSTARCNSQIETLLALIKRNKNVPELQGMVVVKDLVNIMLERFKDGYLNDDGREMLNHYSRSTIQVNSHSIHEWLSKQPDAVKKILQGTTPIWDQWLNKYDYMIKTTVKPRLDLTAPYEYASLQTIAYSGKEINAIFCPIFREVKARLLSILKKNFKLFCDLSPEEFADELNRDIPPWLLYGEEKFLEVDISKYDKSQGEVLLEFEIEIYRMLGVSEEILLLWRNAHECSVIEDKVSGVKAIVRYQRKSGDAATFLGNTVVLMGVLGFLYDMKKIKMGLFSGDDSLLIGDGIDVDMNEICAGVFNLESKFYFYKQPYFCSKFLLNNGDRWFFLPDVVKILTKFGRRDMVSDSHVEEYRISCEDLLKNYTNNALDPLLTAAINERYFTSFSSVLPLIQGIVQAVSSKGGFSQLYIWAPGSIKHSDPSLPKFD